MFFQGKVGEIWKMLFSNVNILLYCFCFRCSGQTQPDADCFNTNPLRPRSHRPHSIVSAICCDQNVYYQWLHDWNSGYTGKTITYRGTVLLNIRLCFVHACNFNTGFRFCLGLPDFKPWWATIDPHIQKEHTEIHKIPKFGVNQGSFDWDTTIYKTSKLTKKCMAIRMLCSDSVQMAIYFSSCCKIWHF